MMGLRRRGLIPIVAAGFALCAPSADADTYSVVSCRDLAGQAAPASDAFGGWNPIGHGAGRDARDLCASSSPRLVSSIAGPWSFPVGTIVTWRFSPPPSTYLAGVSVAYSGYTRPFNGQNQGVIAIWGSESGRLALHEGSGELPSAVVSRVGIHDRWLDFLIACDGPSGYPDCQGDQVHASATIWRSEMTIADETPPNSGPVTGSAVASPSWQGTELFAFSASDQGGGVYQAVLEIDGRAALTRTIDSWSGRCVDTTPSQRVFRYPRPCPTSTDVVLAVDTAQLPVGDGDHDITLRISDAAGNLATVYSARKTIVAPPHRIGPGSDPAERGAANGENASDDAKLSVRWTRTKRATLTSPYGRRNVIRGRLTTAAGAGIRNAKVEFVTAIDGRNAAPLDKGGARTRRDGRFTLILPRNVSSRALILRYRSHVNDTVSIAEATLGLKVKAGVKLRVSPHRATKGRAVRLAGRLVGKPLPRGGKVVELQARNPGGRRITFRTVRASGKTGRFSTRYTFQRGGPAIYEMRARVRAADDYPYAAGASHAVRVRVR
jgi:hypothetical protein